MRQEAWQQHVQIRLKTALEWDLVKKKVQPLAIQQHSLGSQLQMEAWPQPQVVVVSRRKAVQRMGAQMQPRRPLSTWRIPTDHCREVGGVSGCGFTVMACSPPVAITIQIDRRKTLGDLKNQLEGIVQVPAMEFKVRVIQNL